MQAKVEGRKKWKKFGTVGDDAKPVVCAPIEFELIASWLPDQIPATVTETVDSIMREMYGSADWRSNTQNGAIRPKEGGKYEVRAATYRMSELAVVDRVGTGDGPKLYVPRENPDRDGVNNEAYVGGLPEDVDEDRLRGLLEGTGAHVNRINLVRDRKTNVFKGFAFVTFKNVKDVEMAISKRITYDYHILQVDKSGRKKK